MERLAEEEEGKRTPQDGMVAVGEQAADAIATPMRRSVGFMNFILDLAFLLWSGLNPLRNNGGAC